VLLDKAEKREKVRKSKSQKDKRVFSVINQKSKAIYKFPSLHKKEREKKRIQNPKTPSSKTPPSLSFKTTPSLSLSLSLSLRVIVRFLSQTISSSQFRLRLDLTTVSLRLSIFSNPNFFIHRDFNLRSLI
jgi:hypothetical protein